MLLVGLEESNCTLGKKLKILKPFDSGVWFVCGIVCAWMDFDIPKHLFHASDWRGVEAFLQSCRNIPLEKVKQDLERYLGNVKREMKAKKRDIKKKKKVCSTLSWSL